MKIRIIDALVGEELKVSEIENSLENMQEKVGGYIEAIEVERDTTLWLNEEGKLNELEPNILLVHKGEVYDFVVGNAFFAGTNKEGETVSLTDEQIREIRSRVQYVIGDDGKLMKALVIL